MIPEKVIMLTIPLFPYLQAGRQKPQKTKRIRPRDALDLKKMLKEIEKSSVATFDINEKLWSLASVYSSYSPDIHIMLIEMSPNRYVPGPEMIPEKEGGRLMKLWAATLDLIAGRKGVATIHAGYNWSPRAWGKEEEKTGFQSVPTKWHPHLWGWPAFASGSVEKASYAGMVDATTLSPQERRLLGDNNYAKPFGLLIKKRMREKFSRNGLFHKLFGCHNWLVDGRGLCIRFNANVADIFRTPGFFGSCLKPLAVMLEEITRELTETLTTIKCESIDRILVAAGDKLPKNWQVLRAAPTMRPERYIRDVFKRRGYPAGLLKALWRPVWNRCHQKGDPVDWWRKGFAYAMVFNGPAKGAWGELRVMPGVFVGPGGVVEAEGFILRRPEDRKFSDGEIRRKSENLRRLTTSLKKLGFREYTRKKRT